MAIARRPAVQYCELQPGTTECWYSDEQKEFDKQAGEIKVLSLDGSYEEQFSDTIQLRIQQAGFRLAALLNHIFSE